MLTKEQETVGQIIEAVNDFLTAYAKPEVVPSEADRKAAGEALREIRHALIHLGNDLRDARAPIGLTREQRESIELLLKITSEVGGLDVVESARIANAQQVLGALVENA